MMVDTPGQETYCPKPHWAIWGSWRRSERLDRTTLTGIRLTEWTSTERHPTLSPERRGFMLQKQMICPRFRPILTM
jgi:hypothetical protein